MDRVLSLREQIDACRPGSDDLALPALAELAEAARQDRAVAEELDRSQRFDKAVISALHDVPVPGDLCERLLAQAAAGGSPPGVVEPAVATPPQRFWSRRRVIALASLAATLLVAVGIWQAIERQPREVPQSELAEAVVRWHADNGDPRSDGWSPYRQATPPHAALAGLPLRVRKYQTDYGPAVVYDLAPPGQPRAFLLQIKTRDKFNVQKLPFSTIGGTSGGLGVAAWQAGGVLYVLVVGPDGQIDNYLQRATIARASGAQRGIAVLLPATPA